MVLENTDRFELICIYEIFENLEVFIGFARKSENKRCTDKSIRKCRTDFFEKGINMGSVIMSSHELQYFLARMLEWDIEVGEKVFELFQLIDM